VLSLTNLGELMPGDLINLELAQPSEGRHGPVMSGQVSHMGEILESKIEDSVVHLKVQTPPPSPSNASRCTHSPPTRTQTTPTAANTPLSHSPRLIHRTAAGALAFRAA
jgi:hypothetical protein